MSMTPRAFASRHALILGMALTLSALTIAGPPTASASAAAAFPDNGPMAFERTMKGNTDIYTMNSDGTDVSRLTIAPAVGPSAIVVA
jgi:hypothetical protein